MSNSTIEETLGFDTSPVQGFFRDETLFFWLGRTPSIVFWAASYFKNGIYAYGNREDQLLNRMAKAVKLSEKKYIEPEIEKSVARPRKRAMLETGFKDHGFVVFYDLTKKHGEFAEAQKKISKNFVYKTPQNIHELLKAMKSFRNDVQEVYGPYRALRRKAALTFILLDKQAIAALKNNGETMALLEELMANGHEQRVFPILCVEQASDLSAALVKVSDSSIFIGEANETLALKFYKLPLFDSDYGAIKIGTSWDITKANILRRFAAVSLEKTDWLIERQAAIKQQDEDWNQYLEELEGVRP